VSVYKWVWRLLIYMFANLIEFALVLAVLYMLVTLVRLGK